MSPEIVTVGGMQPADVTAASAEVVTEVLGDPAGFLTAAAEGVAQLTSVLHDHLAQLTQTNAALRTATVVYLRTHPQMSLLTIARLLGVTKGVIQKVMRRAEEDAADGQRPFAHLESPSGWET